MSSERSGPGTLREQLRRRKEAHRTVSCEPCRERKVRCDRGHPCLTCTKRQYPDLCHYQRTPRTRHPDSRRLIHVAEDPAPLSPASTLQPRELSPLTRESFSVGKVKPGYTPASLTTAGSAVEAELPNSNGIVALAQGRSTLLVDGSDHRTAFGMGILPLLGSHDANIAPNFSQADKKILEFLASEQHVLELFESYRYHVDPFCSLPVDLDSLEKKLCYLLSLKEDLLSENTTVLNHIPRWFCLLSAVLASGAQASNLGPELRHSLSKHHSQLAFEALHATEYLSQPYKEAIQSLILLGNVLQNEMQPHAAWCLASTTMRLAQCLGVYNRPQASSSTAPPADQDAASLRLALVWQDVLLSLVFGRPPTTSEIDFPEDLKELALETGTQRLAYREAMNWICHLTLWYLSSNQHNDSMGQPQQTLAYIDSLNLSVVSYLSDRQACKSILEIQQHLAFQLHSNFVISTICRPYVSARHVVNMSATERSYTLNRLRTALTKGASAYLQLRLVGSFINRSWAFVHNGLSSILLLSLMSEVRHSEETRMLQSQIINSLEQDSALGVVPNSPPHVNRLSNTCRKALDALKTLRQLSEQEGASGSTSALTDDSIGQAQTTLECRLDTANELTQEQGVDGLNGNNNFASFDFDLPTLGVFDSIMSESSMENTSHHI